MANNNNNGNNKGRYNPDQYTPQALADGLIATMPITMNLNSVVYKEKASTLESKLEEMIETVLEISEIDHVAVKPKLDRDGTPQAILCRAYFCASDVTSGHIVRKGAGDGMSRSGTKTIISLVGNGIIGSGDFELSDHFKKTFAPLVVSDDGKLNIGSLPRNKDIAVLDLDFFAVMSVALGIESDSPYNFTILGCTPIGNGDDFMMLISKYIDVRRNRGRHKKNKMSYHDLDREWAKQNDAYYRNGGKKRSF